MKFLLPDAFLCLMIFMFSSGVSLGAKSAPTAADALNEIKLIKQLYAPVKGAELSLELHEAARDNCIVPYLIADDACRIMAENVDEDIRNFDLTAEESEVLATLSKDLRVHQKDCHYRNWVRLSAKFCFITGFIRYRLKPESYHCPFDCVDELDVSTRLIWINNLPWEHIDLILETGECPDFDVSLPTLFSDLLKRLKWCREKGRFIFPCFQPLDIEFFIRTAAFCYFPAAVSLNDSEDADGGLVTRGMFFWHDIAHASMARNNWGQWLNSTDEEVAHRGVMLAAMQSEAHIIDELYKVKPKVETLEQGLFKTGELIMLMELHEEDNYGSNILDWLSSKASTKYNYWPVMKSASLAFGKLVGGGFHGLESEYKSCFEKHELFPLAAFWLTDIGKSLNSRQHLSKPVNTAEFHKAITFGIQEFEWHKIFYYHNHPVELIETTPIDDEWLH